MPDRNEPPVSDLHGDRLLGSLMTLLRQGAIDVSEAKARARAAAAGGALQPSDVASLGAAMAEVAADRGWQAPLPVAEVAYEAALGALTTHNDAAWQRACTQTAADLLLIIHLALLDQGSLHRYRQAAAIARQAMDLAEQHGLSEELGVLAQRYGALVLDSYTANRSPDNYIGAFTVWLARASEEEAAGPFLGGWPEPLSELAVAEQNLRRALPLLGPQRLGRAYKALAQTLAWQGYLGGPRDDDGLRDAVAGALAALDSDDAQGRLGVLALLGASLRPTDVEDLVAVLDASRPDGLAEEQSAWDAYGQAATLLQDSDPAGALAVLMRRRRLPAPWQDEWLLAGHLNHELQLFSRAFRPAGFEPSEGPLEVWRDRAAAACAAARTAEEARTAAAMVVAAMLSSTSRDQEGLVLALAGPVASLDVSLWNEHAQAVSYLIATVTQGAAVNAWNADDAAAAAAGYLDAARRFRTLGLATQMVQSIAHADDAIQAGADRLDETTAWLAAYSLDCETLAPDRAPDAVRQLAEHVLAITAGPGRVSGIGTFYLLQVLKGRRYAALLDEGTTGLRWDDGTSAAQARVRQAEADLPAGSDLLRPEPFDAAMGDDDVVGAWVDQYEKGPSETAEDRIANLQRAVERHLDKLLVPTRDHPLLSYDDIVALLDDRTALLDLYEGPTAAGALGCWQTLVTKQRTFAAIGAEEMPNSHVKASWRGREVTLPFAGFWVGALRRAVQDWPGPLDVAPEGEQLLASAGQRYLRVIEANLLRLEGIDRLIIVPHGPSRFIPLHLATMAGNPLVDRFEVSYLLNLHQLRRRPDPGGRRDGVGVFGLTYTDQPGLPVLDDSATEASAIAQLFGTVPFIDADATEEAFAEALQERRWVHLRAHGRMFVDAASYHTVFLHPSQQDDGRFRAFEALPLDLRGLELVTLGACETALCRVDRSDNPRGLPAALVLAGADSVVGTLWEVERSVSTGFFTELYRRLAADADVPTAFAAAQVETRQRHPQYRDWGAFYLVGAAP